MSRIKIWREILSLRWQTKFEAFLLLALMVFFAAFESAVGYYWVSYLDMAWPKVTLGLSLFYIVLFFASIVVILDGQTRSTSVKDD